METLKGKVEGNEILVRLDMGIASIVLIALLSVKMKFDSV